MCLGRLKSDQVVPGLDYGDGSACSLRVCVSPRSLEETWWSPDETLEIAAQEAALELQTEPQSAPPSPHTPFLLSPGVTPPGGREGKYCRSTISVY